MAPWHDIISVAPEDGQMILARRYPEDTPPLSGQWSLADAGLLLPSLPSHTAPWVIPWTFLTHWRPLTTPPAYPAPGSPKGWRDTYFYPPNNSQPVWLRRFPGDFAALPATYSAPDGLFTVVPCQGATLSAPFYCFYQWKPM
jgi:hypothetical protein